MAVTSAYDWRILTRSFCMSSTACVMIFSGSSRFLRTLLRLLLATLEKRSNRFIERAVSDAAAGRVTAIWRPTKADEGVKPSTWQATRAMAAAADRILMVAMAVLVQNEMRPRHNIRPPFHQISPNNSIFGPNPPLGKPTTNFFNLRFFIILATELLARTGLH